MLLSWYVVEVVPVLLSIGVAFGVNVVVLYFAARLFGLDVELKTAAIGLGLMALVLLVGALIHPLAALIALGVNLFILKNTLNCGLVTAIGFCVVWTFVNILIEGAVSSFRAFVSSAG